VNGEVGDVVEEPRRRQTPEPILCEEHRVVDPRLVLGQVADLVSRDRPAEEVGEERSRLAELRRAAAVGRVVRERAALAIDQARDECGPEAAT
jgi:hypothetical protein